MAYSNEKLITDQIDNLKDLSRDELIDSYETMLRQREASYEEFLEVYWMQEAMMRALPDLVFLMDAEGRYIQATIGDPNDLAEGSEGLSMIGKTVHKRLPAELAEKWIAAIQKVFETGILQTLEYQLIVTSGETRNFEARVVRCGEKHVIAVVRNTTVLRETEHQLRKAVDRNHLLIQEIHHRVKNNMLVISGLINLQQRYVKDPETKDLLKEIQDRVKSMAQIHQALQQAGDFQHLDIQKQINGLADQLLGSHNARAKIRLQINIESINLNVETTTQINLLVNELLTNVIKHAFPGDQHGSAEISLKQIENSDQFELIIRDDGVGLPENFDPNKIDSYGFFVVQTITKHQLRGDLEINSNGGTTVTVRFKELAYKKRA